MSDAVFRNFIDGQWVAGESVIANINPSDTSDTIGEYARATAADGLAAIEAANRAFGDWAQSGLEQRKAILDFIGNELIARKDEIGAVLAREEGKTLAEGVGEVGRSGRYGPVSTSTCSVNRSVWWRLLRRGIFRWRWRRGKSLRRSAMAIAWS